MPRNKRNKVISLTKVKSKGSALKDALIDTVREAASTHRHVFVFSVSNMRNDKFKDFRQVLKKDYNNSVIYMGKGSIMSLALGLTEDNEIRAGTHLVAKHIVSGAALLFTNSDSDKIADLLQSFEEPNFARSGFIATKQFELQAGILEDQPFSMETQLRKLGLPTKLDNGKVRLERDVVVCKKGSKLTPEQCKILEIFGIQMALMRCHLICHLDMEECEYREYEEQLDLTNDNDEDDELISYDNDEDDEMAE